MQQEGVLNQGVRQAGEILDAGMFWRGNLAKAVKRRDFKGTLWGILAFSLLLFLYVWQHMQAVKLGYEVQGLKAEKQQLTNDYYYLKYKVGEKNSLANVEKIAREELGMVTPRPDQVIILEDKPTLASPRWFSFWTSTMTKTDNK